VQIINKDHFDLKDAGTTFVSSFMLKPGKQQFFI